MTYSLISHFRQNLVKQMLTVFSSQKKISGNAHDRRLLILKYLLKMRTLTANHIKRLVYPVNAMSTVYYALDVLKKRKLVDFHAYSLGRGQGSLKRLYFITNKGFELLEKHDHESTIINEYRKHPEPFIDSYYNHRLKLLDLWVFLHLEIKDQCKHTLNLFLPEWEKYEGKQIVLRFSSIRIEDYSIRPDATFILENIETKKEALFFVEIDTGSESLHSRVYPCITSRLERYQNAFKQLAFSRVHSDFERFSGARLLFITSSQVRIENILNKINIDSALNDGFLFSTHDLISKYGLINGTFRKSGFEGAIGINSKPIS